MLRMAKNCTDLFAVFDVFKLAGVFRFQYGVALARLPFKSLAIYYRDMATFILKQMAGLQQARRNANSATTDAQHPSQIAMRQLQMLGLNAVLNRQQPARQALLYAMIVTTSGIAHQLRQEDI